MIPVQHDGPIPGIRREIFRYFSESVKIFSANFCGPMPKRVAWNINTIFTSDIRDYTTTLILYIDGQIKA